MPCGPARLRRSYRRGASTPRPPPAKVGRRRLRRPRTGTGRGGVGVGELNTPRSVAVDRGDNLYVVDMTGRVREFSLSAVFVRWWELPQTDKGKPKGMGRDQEGNIVVVEPHYQRVNHFSTEGKLLAQWGQYGTNAGQFPLPRAVAVNSRGEAFVSEYGLVERVQRFGLTAMGQVSRLPPSA